MGRIFNISLAIFAATDHSQIRSHSFHYPSTGTTEARFSGVPLLTGPALQSTAHSFLATMPGHARRASLPPTFLQYFHTEKTSPTSGPMNSTFSGLRLPSGRVDYESIWSPVDNSHWCSDLCH